MDWMIFTIFFFNIDFLHCAGVESFALLVPDIQNKLIFQ